MSARTKLCSNPQVLVFKLIVRSTDLVRQSYKPAAPTESRYGDSWSEVTRPEIGCGVGERERETERETERERERARERESDRELSGVGVDRFSGG